MRYLMIITYYGMSDTISFKIYDKDTNEVKQLREEHLNAIKTFLDTSRLIQPRPNSIQWDYELTIPEDR